MSSDDLKSEEKRKEDKAIAQENMRKAEAPQEEKAISTTYVPIAIVLIRPAWLHQPCILVYLCCGGESAGLLCVKSKTAD